QSLVSDTKVVIFSKSWCPYCKRAKALILENYPDVPTKILELDELSDGDDIQAYLLQKTGQRTVPNVFVAQKHIGGCDNVVALQRSGELAKIMA
ncbi:glutaredoxin, partial [Calocera cornea HHB12733]